MAFSSVSGNPEGYNKCLWETNQYGRTKVFQTGPKKEKLALVLPTLGQPYIELVELRPRTVFKVTPRKQPNGKPKFYLEVMKAYGLPKQRSRRTADD